nr:hypothetical protein [Tanacetum cinerariifolium]
DEDDVNEVIVEPTPPSSTLATPPPPPQQEHIPLPPQANTTQPLPPPPPQQQPSQTTELSMTLLNQLLETCATLTKQVANLEQDNIAQAIKITKHKQKVKRLEKKRQLKSYGLKRLRKGRLEESQVNVYHLDLEHAEKVLKVVTTATTDATTTTAQVPKASAPRKRWGKGILVEEPKPLKRQVQIEQDKAFARELEAELNANINLNDVVDQVKRKERQYNIVIRYHALKRKLVTEAQARKNMMHYNSIQAFLKKGEKEIEEEGSKRKSESSKQRADKKQRIDEEVEELKTHLQIIANNDHDDDVYTEPTLLA